MASKDDYDNMLAAAVQRARQQSMQSLFETLINHHMANQGLQDGQDSYNDAGSEILRGMYGNGIGGKRVSELKDMGAEMQGRLEVDRNNMPSLLEILKNRLGF